MPYYMKLNFLNIGKKPIGKKIVFIALFKMMLKIM